LLPDSGRTDAAAAELKEDESMGTLSELNRRAHRMGIIDVKLFAVSALFLGLLIAKLFPDVLALNSWLLALLSIASAVHPLMVLSRRDA